MTVLIYVPDIPEFQPILDGAAKVGGCRVEPTRAGYWAIIADEELRLERKTLGLGPALWNSALTGGFRGRIEEYGRDVLRIVSENEKGRE